MPYDPFDPAYCDDPYRFYDQARRTAPIAYNQRYQAWDITRHEDVVAVLKDPARFSSRHNLDFMVPLPPEVVAVMEQGYPEAAGLFNNDPPGHTRVRSLFSVAFTPRRVAAMEPQIRKLAHDLIDQFAAVGRADLVTQFAHPLPMTVIADLLGIPREDMAQVKAWHDHSLTLNVPGLPLEEQLAAAHSRVAYQRYYAAMIEDRRVHPRDDLVTAMVQARFPDAEPFTVPEMITQLIILLAAGHETTTSMISNLVRLLLEHPDQWRAVEGDPGLIGAAIDETIRFEAPVQMEPRVATADVELNGTLIREGSRVHVLYGSGNRDAALADAPDQFNIHRAHPQRHVGFGYGIHFCIGAALARLEGRVALETLRERLPNLRLAPDYTPTYQPSFIFRGPAKVLIEWDAPAA
jgi:cytochrome P450